MVRRCFESMNGIRIYGQPVFEELFRPLFDYLQAMTWLTMPGAFRFPYEWEDASDFDPVNQVWTGGPMAEFDRDLVQIREGNSHYGYFTSVDLFPKYAPAISEDWNTIYGLRQPVAPLEWLRAAYARGTYETAELADVTFVNDDGSFWEFFPRDESLLRILEQHLPGLPVGFAPTSTARDAAYLQMPPDNHEQVD